MDFAEFRNEKVIKTIQKPRTLKDYDYLTDPSDLFPRYRFEKQRDKYNYQNNRQSRRKKKDREALIQKMHEFDKYQIPASVDVAIRHMNGQKVG